MALREDQTLPNRDHTPPNSPGRLRKLRMAQVRRGSLETPVKPAIYAPTIDVVGDVSMTLTSNVNIILLIF